MKEYLILKIADLSHINQVIENYKHLILLCLQLQLIKSINQFKIDSKNLILMLILQLIIIDYLPNNLFIYLYFYIFIYITSFLHYILIIINF